MDASELDSKQVHAEVMAALTPLTDKIRDVKQLPETPMIIAEASSAVAAYVLTAEPKKEEFRHPMRMGLALLLHSTMALAYQAGHEDGRKAALADIGRDC